MAGPLGASLGVPHGKCTLACRAKLRHSLSLRHPSASRCLVLTNAKRSAVKQASKDNEEEQVAASKELLSPYEPLDDQGNEWWVPPERDFWEGEGWEILGKSANFILPAVLALAVAGGIYAAASYVKGPAPAAPAAQEQPSAKSAEGKGVDDILSGAGSSGDSDQGSFSDTPF